MRLSNEKGQRDFVTSWQAATNFFLFTMMFAGLIAPPVAIVAAILFFAGRRKLCG